MKKLKSLSLVCLGSAMAVMLSGCVVLQPNSVAAGDQQDPNIKSYEGSCSHVLGFSVSKKQCLVANIIKTYHLRKTYSSDTRAVYYLGGLFDIITTDVRGTQ